MAAANRSENKPPVRLNGARACQLWAAYWCCTVPDWNGSFLIFPRMTDRQPEAG